MLSSTDLERIDTLMRWRTPSDNMEWIARATGSNYWHKGMTPEEAVAGALAGPQPKVEHVEELW